MAISFGVVTGATCAYGTVTGSDIKDSAEIAQARNALGAITNEQAYSRTVKASISGVLTGSAPSSGTAATIAGKAGLLENVETSETNTGYQQFSATNTKGDSATQVALV